MIGEAPESQTEPADRRSDWMADALLARSALAHVGRVLEPTGRVII
ncbi:hypothetical protein [Methyloversatilis sp.]